jgi:hypothetical protein
MAQSSIDGKLAPPPEIHPAADPYPKTEFTPLKQSVSILNQPGDEYVSIHILFNKDGREIVDAEAFWKEAEHWAAMTGKSLMACSRKPRRSAEAGLEASPGSLTNGNEVTLNRDVKP